MPHQTTTVDHRAWGARFGWIAGGITGVLLGFAATYGLEVWLLRPRLHDGAAAAASRAASVIVPVFFVAGALAGHAFGARGGAARYRALGVSAGIALAVLGWALLVLAR
jgi:uncharacterized membrane protein